MFSTDPGDRIAQIEAMRKGVDYRIDVQIRGFTCKMRPLTIKESEQIASTVMQKFKQLPESQKNSLAENLILAKETLELASTSDVEKTDPDITQYIMDRMTNDELQYLHRQYIAACDKVNPVLEEMPIDEVKALVDAIKKKDLHLTELSFLQAVNVSRFLIFGE